MGKTYKKLTKEFFNKLNEQQEDWNDKIDEIIGLHQLTKNMPRKLKKKLRRQYDTEYVTYQGNKDFKLINMN